MGVGGGSGPLQGKVYLGSHCEGTARHSGEVMVAGVSGV